jgi:hypothetical protein
MKLITEHIEDVQYVTEEKNGKKSSFIEGIYMQAEQKNRNGRVYPKAVLEREANRYCTEYVNKNRAFGELGHPDSPSINLDRVSHMITKLQADGNNFVGKAKIMNTPNGTIVKSLLDGGANLGVSTRGVGSLRPSNGYQLVQDDFRLATAADIVADPSAPDAFVQGIMENKEWIMTPHGWQEKDLEQAQRIIKSVSQNQIEEVSLQLFENFIRRL